MGNDLKQFIILCAMKIEEMDTHRKFLDSVIIGLQLGNSYKNL